MNRLSPALTQLLPLLVYIVVDTFVTDARISIGCAVAFAIGQLAYGYGKTRAVEWFVVLDLVLIVGFGGFSIVSGDELFFKLKPAIIEVFSLVFMLGLLVAPARFFEAYLGRFTPESAVHPDDTGVLKGMLGLMCGWMVLHIGAVLYTALYASKELWVFVSGPGFYLVLLPMGAVILWKRRGDR